MAISKIDSRFFISSLIGLKLCTRIDSDNTQNRIGANFEFPPLKIWRPLNFEFALHVIYVKIVIISRAFFVFLSKVGCRGNSLGSL